MPLVLTAMAVLALAGCGSSSPATPSAGTLASQYFDTFSADEQADIAAHAAPDEFLGSLLGAYQCADAPDNHTGCPPGAAVTATAHRLGGTLYERSIIVKHHSGHFELLPLYVAARADGSDELIDATGQAYAGGLDDYRAHNGQLGSDDLMLLAKPFAQTQGGFRLQAVTGHTKGGRARWPYALIGLLVVVLGFGAAMVIKARRRPKPVDV